MINKWDKISNNYFISEISQQSDLLPIGIYQLQEDQRRGLYLSQIGEKFEFLHKIYGIEKKFIQHVVKTYNSTKGNMGIMLSGVKGTGKTVTAELICNEVNLPVIIINEPFDNLANFISSIQQDIIIFFDEYEKIHRNNDNVDILTIMDGVMNNEYRKLYLLTTNSNYVSPYLLQRPGRIRYVKNFEDLSLESILEIIDDKLKYTEFKNEIVNFISNLNLITVDIVKAIIDEVNIHQISPNKFKDIFNIEFNKELFKITEIEDNKENVVIYENIDIIPHPKILNENKIKNQNIYINDGNCFLGKIKKVIKENIYLVESHNDYDEENDCFLLKTWKIEKVENRHRYFDNWF